VTGRDASGVPVAVPVDVVAQDQQLQRASCHLVALLEVPVDQITSKLTTAIAAASPSSQPSSPLDLERRVANLEEQVKSLQAKIDLLTELLRGKR
jgi:hypothetical protein